MAKQEVTTQIDELVSYLKAHGETSITDLSKALVVGESTLNDWASILEKAGMVKVVYKAGRMFLSPVEATTSESGENVSRIIQAEKEDIQSEVNSQQALLNQITSRINSLQGLNDEINKYAGNFIGGGSPILKKDFGVDFPARLDPAYHIVSMKRQLQLQDLTVKQVCLSHLQNIYILHARKEIILNEFIYVYYPRFSV